MRRRLLYPVLLAAMAAPFVLAAFVRLPVLVLEPGPAPDVAARTKIEAPTFESKGSIRLTTAQIRSTSGVTAVEALQGLLDRDKVVVPRSSIYPPDQSEGVVKAVQAAQMAQSESAAAVAALDELGMPYEPDGVFVDEVIPRSPGAASLKAGDVITALNGSSVLTLRDLTGALDRVKGGQAVEVTVKRADSLRKRLVKTAGSPAKGGGTRLGIQASQSYRASIRVRISADEIGGPSAGLMFALSIFDRLVPEDLTAGRVIAGTGTIENSPEQSGRVGAVGAVRLKVRSAQKVGADVFLVPKAELAQASAVAGPNLKVIGVSTLKEAISALRKLPRAA